MQSRNEASHLLRMRILAQLMFAKKASHIKTFSNVNAKNRTAKMTLDNRACHQPNDPAIPGTHAVEGEN